MNPTASAADVLVRTLPPAASTWASIGVSTAPGARQTNERPVEGGWGLGQVLDHAHSAHLAQPIGRKQRKRVGGAAPGEKDDPSKPGREHGRERGFQDGEVADHIGPVDPTVVAKPFEGAGGGEVVQARRGQDHARAGGADLGDPLHQTGEAVRGVLQVHLKELGACRAGPHCRKGGLIGGPAPDQDHPDAQFREPDSHGPADAAPAPGEDAQIGHWRPPAR